MRMKKLDFVLLFMSFAFLIFALASCSSSDNSNSSNGNAEQINTSTDNDTYYTVTFKNYDGEVLQTFSVKKGHIPAYNSSNQTRDGDNNYLYTFSGWNPSVSAVNEDTIYVATYSKLPLPYYPVELSKNINDAGTITGEGIYRYGDKVSIAATTNPGYTFNGWYKDNEPYKDEASFEYTIDLMAISLEARYSINQYTITLNNQGENVTVSGVTSGNKYDYNTLITLNSINNSGKFIVWTVNGNIENIGDDYTFRVPSNNVNIVVTTENHVSIEENKLYFGSYPQTKITDDSLIAELDTLAGEKPTSTNSYNWTDYNYYSNGIVQSYMFYQDIDYDNNGTYDYRGVYFTKYRPTMYLTSANDASSSMQDDNGYTPNKTYWFSYDPIEWDVLNESNGKALIIANLVLDSQDYYPSTSQSQFEHNGCTGYGNNYELSAIRKFLNDNFYNTSFNKLQKALIEETIVDNSAASTQNSTNNYACNNTTDKIFLLSYSELNTYYKNSTPRYTDATDYAKCQGLNIKSSGTNSGYSYWWLRSPDYSSSDAVPFTGSSNGSTSVYASFIGVRPACWIKV